MLRFLLDSYLDTGANSISLKVPFNRKAFTFGYQFKAVVCYLFIKAASYMLRKIQSAIGRLKLWSILASAECAVIAKPNLGITESLVRQSEFRSCLKEVCGVPQALYKFRMSHRFTFFLRERP